MRGLLIGLLMALQRRAIAERRKGRTWSFVALTAFSGVALAVFVGWIAFLMAMLVYLGVWWLALLLGALAAVAIVPGPLARAVAVPLGQVRLAYQLGRISADGDSVGLVLAARALNRQRAPDPDDAAWIEARRDAAGRLTDAQVIATGLVAAARGDRDGARALLESVVILPAAIPAARELAAEWLGADDAERGRWDRIAARAAQRGHRQLGVDAGELDLPDQVDALRSAGAPGQLLWPATPLLFFLEGVAARLTGAVDAPGDAALLVRWIEAPRRRKTWGLFRRATAAPRISEAPPPAGEVAVRPATPSGDPIAAAVGAHVAALGARDRDHLVAAALAWDGALGSADARARILARAIDVGAPPVAGSQVLDELSRDAADDLARLITSAELSVDGLPRSSPTLAAAISKVRNVLLDQLELAVSRTAHRVHDKRPLPAIDEWRELLALRRAHQRAIRIGGAELRRLAFPHLHEELTSWLVWLWNQRDQHVLSHAMTCWLLAEALAVGDAQAIEAHARNAALTIPAT
jgi:hypothetical protein